MKTYAALSGSGGGRWQALHRTEYPNILVSFHHDKAGTVFDRIEYDVKFPMLDSGAFSVHTLGKTVDLDAYIAYAVSQAEKRPQIRVTNLDVIPGKTMTRGAAMSVKPPTARDVKKAVAESLENADALRASGLRVIEVHHLADPLENLDLLVERRRPGEVIGVGGLGIGSPQQIRRAHGDTVFARLRDLCGWDAFPPVHGFGVSDDWIGFRYPLATCDSSTWITPARYGRVLDGYSTRKANVRDSNRIRNYDIEALETIRFLDRWRDREEQVRKHWQDRGVNILEEGGARVDV